MKLEHYKITPLTESGLLTAMTVLLAVMATYLPVIGILAALFWAIPIVLLTVRHGLRWAVMALLVSGVVMALVIEPVIALRMVISFGPTGIMLGYGFRKGWSGPRVLAMSMLASVLAKLLSLGLVFAITSVNPMELQMDGLRESFETTFSAYEAVGVNEGELSKAKEQMSQSLDMVQMLIPLVIGLMGVVDTLINYYLAGCVMRRLGMAFPQLPPFSEWRLPVGFVYLMGFALVGTYWGGTREIDVLLRVAYNANMLALLAGLVQGISLLVFFAERHRISRILQAVIIFFLITNGLLAQIVAFTGFFDMVIDYRKKFSKKV